MRWQQFSLAALMIACGMFALPVGAQPPEGAGPPAQEEGGERGARGDRRERGERGERGGRFGRGGPDGPGGPGGPGGGFMRRNPLMLALDTDEDGELSAAEIDNAVVALKKLDKNEDGKLTRDELRPEFLGGPDGPGGPGGPDGPDPAAMVARWMGNDKNEDGKLSKDEMPERLLGIFDRANTDQDEFLTKDELTKFAEQRANRGGLGGRRGQRGPDGADGGDRPRRPRRPDDVQ